MQKATCSFLSGGVPSGGSNKATRGYVMNTAPIENVVSDETNDRLIELVESQLDEVAGGGYSQYGGFHSKSVSNTPG